MEAIGTLAGGVAHDFNNMLGAIIGYAELALITVDPSDPMHTSFKKILDVAHRSSELTRQLLAFARKEIIEPKVIDINKSIDKLLIMLQRLIGENIELAWRPGEGPLNVVLDPSQLDQILANLCVNARDAIEYIGKISITTDSHVFDEQTCSFHPDCIPGAYVSLAISDTGCGIEKDILANIFEPFFTTKAQGKGTGLGLSTVYGIVRQNRAFITVYSEGDQGSTFSIYFPKSSSEEDSVKSTPPEVLHSRGETVLLVEDDPVVLEMAQTMLKHLGYNVLSTGSPTEALTIAQRNQGKIDILLTDVVMPEVTGRELVDKLNKTNPEIKPLFMSGYTADMIANQGVLEEGITFLQKPFSLQSLSTKIRSVLDQQR
jgi:CheY-like chemotaxis protein